jgi:imidazolonepropionase-like amidohydrolase
LEWYVQAGLPALARLQTATINPAIFRHKEREMGTISKDKLADLVIILDNPLENIKKTRGILATIDNRKLLDWQALDGLLQHISDF